MWCRLAPARRRMWYEWRRWLATWLGPIGFRQGSCLRRRPSAGPAPAGTWVCRGSCPRRPGQPGRGKQRLQSMTTSDGYDDVAGRGVCFCKQARDRGSHLCHLGPALGLLGQPQLLGGGRFHLFGRRLGLGLGLLLLWSLQILLLGCRCLGRASAHSITLIFGNAFVLLLQNI